MLGDEVTQWKSKRVELQGVHSLVCDGTNEIDLEALSRILLNSYCWNRLFFNYYLFELHLLGFEPTLNDIIK